MLNSLRTVVDFGGRQDFFGPRLNIDAFQRSDYTNGIGMNVWASVVNSMASEGSFVGRFSYFQPIFH